MLHQQACDLLLAPGPARRRSPRAGARHGRVGILAHVDQEGRGGDQVEDGRADQAVVEDHVGPGQERGAPPGEEPGVAGAGADQVDGHGATSPPSPKPSMAAPPPLSRARATSAPTVSGSSPWRASRITVCPSPLATSPDTRSAVPSPSGSA